MFPPHKGSCAKEAPPKTSHPKKKKRKEDNYVPVQFQISKSKSQLNQAHCNAGSIVNTTREHSDVWEEELEAG